MIYILHIKKSSKQKHEMISRSWLNFEKSILLAVGMVYYVSYVTCKYKD